MFSNGLPHARKEIFGKAISAISLGDEDIKERTKRIVLDFPNELSSKKAHWGLSNSKGVYLNEFIF